MTERKIGQFIFQNNGSEINVSLHEDSLGWPSIITEIQGQTMVHDKGANHEEVILFGLGAESGLKAIKAYRESQQNT